MYIGPVGISGYAPWATWLEILVVVRGVAAAVAIVAWLPTYRKRRMGAASLISASSPNHNVCQLIWDKCLMLLLAKIGSVPVGKGHEVKVMGIINASPESFFKGSVRTGPQEIAAEALEMQEAGAHIIDIGAMSTAPYLDTITSVEEEIRRLKVAIEAVKSACGLAISVDTPRAQVASVAVKLGADAINDIAGLKYDSKMAGVAADAGVPVIAGAYSVMPASGTVAGTVKALRESLAIAKKAGVRDVLVDPSIGFFRAEGKNPFFTKMTDRPWYARDLEVLSSIDRLAPLGPVCVSASRKSFIGHLLNLPAAEQRLAPSITCEIITAMSGASLVRTHGVRETVQALTMLQLLSRAGKRL